MGELSILSLTVTIRTWHGSSFKSNSRTWKPAEPQPDPSHPASAGFLLRRERAAVQEAACACYCARQSTRACLQQRRALLEPRSSNVQRTDAILSFRTFRISASRMDT